MDKKIIVKQNGYKNCGSACLLSVMRYYGFNTSLDEVSFILKTTNEGTNAFNIINGSRTFGFDGFGSHYTYDEIINNKISFPIICHVLKNKMYHFIVVYNVNKNMIEIMDPSSNITKVSKEYFKSIYLNTSLVIYPVKELKSSNKITSIFNFIFDYIKQEYKTIIKIFGVSVLVILISIIINFYLYIIIDKILPNYNYIKLLLVTIVFIVIYLTKDILNYVRNKYIIYIQNKLFTNININFIRKFFYLPYQYFKSKSLGEIESRINDIKEFKEIYSKILITLSVDTIFIMLSSIVLLLINYKLFLLLIIEMVFYLIIILVFKNTNNKKIDNNLISDSSYNKTLNESINSYEVDKNLNLLELSIKKLEIKTIDYSLKNKEYESSLNNQELLKNIIIDLFYIISIFISVILINKGVLTLGSFILFNSLFIYFIEPIKNIISLNYNYLYIKEIYNRINDLFMVSDNKNNYSIKKLEEDIIISNLTYKANGLNNMFNSVNLNIKYGSKILLYGESGSGKSTICKIILKYLNDYEGEIFFGNINLKDISSSIISYNFTYVSQNSYLIYDTIKNNIIYDRDISNDKYQNVIDICNLNILINSKKERNNFIIEDNGFNISGGERQKIILARSLLKDSNYLILDEALSEVDLDEEIEILNRIFDKYKDKTIIYVSHKKEMINYFRFKYQIERRKVNDK